MNTDEAMDWALVATGYSKMTKEEINSKNDEALDVLARAVRELREENNTASARVAEYQKFLNKAYHRAEAAESERDRAIAEAKQLFEDYKDLRRQLEVAREALESIVVFYIDDTDGHYHTTTGIAKQALAAMGWEE